ncbi:MAG: TetR family transcriptional regulator [Kutzneria sp.]|nr:TetR family transcriptional regulator [Kutzneria sp.]
MSDRGGRAPGLRERKKARTRAEIQRQALRLFRERGYATTTVEQIAEAAEVAPSTVFRYFPNKEALADLTEYYPLRAELAEAFRAQPAELDLVAALRRAIRAVLDGQSPEHRAARRERELLMLTVPELWVANLDSIGRAMDAIAELAADRVGGHPEDPAVRNVVRTVCGVALAVWFDTARNPDADVVAELDEALSFLEAAQQR